MVETKDVRQLRQLSLELLRQLRAGQEAVRRSVAKAASASSLDSSSSYDSETPPSQEMSSMASRASCPQDAQQGDPCDMSWPGGASSWGSSPPPTKCRHQESLGPLRPHSAPLPASSDSNDPELSAELDSLLQEAQAMRSAPDQQSKLPKPRVIFKKESPVPERIWRLRPYLGYDWIAGSLDNSSPVTSKSEAFFSKLQKFREANQEECVCSDPEPQILGLREGGGVKGDHECVYCYRVNRRLFLVPSDPGTPCRLCRTPRDQRGPETLAEPAQVRVSVPLSVLDPPHQYRIHRRKSFDASDTLALPRIRSLRQRGRDLSKHCLLGWDILPPKPEKSSALKSLDLWSCVSAKAQHRKLSATSPSRLGPIPPALTPSILPGPTTPRQLLHPPQEGPAHAGPTCHPDLVRTPGPLTLRPPAEALRTGHLEEDSASVIVSSLSPMAGAPSPASAGVDSGPTS
ncbi:migration and invasion-inhibitory protein isoform X3 [Equus quagga]|uniref:migration and invasion-inhibitory protein isoform X3 n=1 Tax=Equus quagga TaxID=89248 RepID=UPI001EE20FE8|nr:migration and invasion-inhibitory protein isoform X3 [Equus quagga]